MPSNEVGEVVYKATIDTDGLTQDIKEAEKDIKKTSSFPSENFGCRRT